MNKTKWKRCLKKCVIMNTTFKVKEAWRPKKIKKGVLELDTHTTLLSQLEVLTKQLDGATIIPENVIQVQAFLCMFYGQDHANAYYVPDGFSKED